VVSDERKHFSPNKQEDDLVIKLVEKYGPKKWSLIAQHLQGRIGKQCRERYLGWGGVLRMWRGAEVEGESEC
jgi:hypothetical protein